MLRTSSNVTQEQMTVGDEGVKVEVGLETYASSEVTLPPVSKLLQGERVVAEPQHVPVSHADKDIQDVLAPELDKLLSKRDQFGGSPTYLAQASGLAAMCGRLDDAQQLAEEALKQAEGDDDLTYRYARATFHGGDAATAREVWRRLAKRGDLRSCLRMVELSVSDTDLEQADAWLQKAMKLDSLDWRVHMLAGTLALIAGKGDKSVHHHRLAIAERPRSVRLHYTLALAHALNGHLANALRTIRIAAGLNPFGKATLIAWADLCREDGSPKAFASASRALARFLSLYPDESAVVTRQAALLYDQGDSRRAHQVLSEARRRLPDSAIANNLGVLAAHSKNRRQAVREFSEARRLATSPHDHALATANLVQALFDSGLVDQAVEIAGDYLRTVAEDDVLVGDQGHRVADTLVHSYISQHNMSKAISLAQRWLRRDVHPELRTSLADVCAGYFALVKADPEQAYEYAYVAYDIQSSLSAKGKRWNMTLNNLVFTLIEMERLDEARHHAAKLEPGDGDEGAVIYATRGLLAIRLGQMERGEALYRRGISQAVRRDLKARMRQRLSWELGRYWASRGVPSRAKRFLKRATVIAKDDVWPMRDIQRQASDLLRQL